ncbi:MAG: hypothetical protein ACJ8HQ_08335 [Chthoniobacterales bacterium]
MKPVHARIVVTLLVSAVAISGIVFVNSRYHGSFLAGLLLIVLPVLALSFSLPHLIAVRCPHCQAKMRFHFVRPDREGRCAYAYVCASCAGRYEWRAGESSSTLDS